MWLFLFCFIVAWFLFYASIHRKEDIYIPRFKGDWENLGTDINENWVFNEPRYDSRFVNIIPTEDGRTIINLSRFAKDSATQTIKVSDQLEADLYVKHIHRLYPETIVQPDERQRYINVFLENGSIYLQGSYSKDENAREVLSCMDQAEYEELMSRARHHFGQYTSVFERQSDFT